MERKENQLPRYKISLWLLTVSQNNISRFSKNNLRELLTWELINVIKHKNIDLIQFL